MLLKSKIYILCTLSFSVLLYVSTGIQFWITDYFIKVLKVKQSSVNIGYAVISITGPTTGTVFGGYVMNRIGGY